MKNYFYSRLLLLCLIFSGCCLLPVTYDKEDYDELYDTVVDTNKVNLQIDSMYEATKKPLEIQIPELDTTFLIPMPYYDIDSTGLHVVYPPDTYQNPPEFDSLLNSIMNEGNSLIDSLK